MKILVLGSGGREHALVWKLLQSAGAEKIWCAPGNGGIASEAECLPLDLSNVKATADLAQKLGVDLTIVGPEMPLVLGVADEFSKRGLTLLGPTQQAAQLEGSKVFAKQFMARYTIPTAVTYGIFENASDARAALHTVRWPLVIKADGLCAGKGVLVTSSLVEAADFIERAMMRREFGDAGKRLLLEEALVGEELSYIVLTDGKNFVPMAPTRDHKRAFDGDEGPNTGGMGAYSTDDILPAALEKKMADTIVKPTLAGLEKDGIPYKGFLYFGLMLTAEGPKVLEYNCRLGDPETQAIMLRADFDFAAACMEAARGNLRTVQANWSPAASVCVVVASQGYPSLPITGVPINGLEEAARESGAVIFHAGTRRDGNNYYTSGGRILGVAAWGESLATSCRISYDSLSRIRIDGAHFRRDIGRKMTKMGRAAAEAPNG
ncbi:MAG: phosphoribosylamine--glycine ligase [Candidatus Acidiferrales bacterium]